MPATISIQVKPKPGDVVHGKATVEADPAAKRKKGKDVPEPSIRKVLIHEGLPDTFDIELEDDQRIILELSAKEHLVLDKEQFVARKEAVEEPPEVDASPPPHQPIQPPAKPQATLKESIAAASAGKSPPISSKEVK